MPKTYEKYLGRLGGSLPGRKSRDRNEFERFGRLPEGLKDHQAEVTPELHTLVVDALMQSDNALRAGDLEWFNENPRENKGSQFGGPVLHGSIAQSAGPAVSSGSSRQHPDGSFMDEVAKLKEEGFSTEKAMLQVAKRFPHLHEQYLKAAGGAVHLSPGTSQPTIGPTVPSGAPRQHPNGSFMDRVHRLKEKTGLSTELAMKRVVKAFPELHQQYLTEGRP